jgi:hypothetical protein
VTVDTPEVGLTINTARMVATFLRTRISTCEASLHPLLNCY